MCSNGTELRTIMSDAYYDFNLQQFVDLPEEVLVSKSLTLDL
jgi:hypothetical protein